MTDSLLSISDLDAFYGESQVLFDVDVDIEEQEVVGIFGRNGMGKTTLLRSIVNQVEHTGTITFSGDDISELQSYEIVRRGIAYIPEERDIYADLTVKENISLAASQFVDDDEMSKRLDRILELFPNLEERIDQDAGTLSGGEQQMLAIARGLIIQPELILLDEPTEGLAPIIVDRLMETLEELAADGQTIVLVEQNINRTLSLVDRGYFIENGRVVADGTAEELEDDTLQQQYLTV